MPSALRQVSWFLPVVVLTMLVAAPPFARADPGEGASAPAAGIFWGGKAFSDEQGLTEWLRIRGASMRVWTERHADAAAVLRSRGTVRARPSSPQPGAGQPVPAVVAAQPRSVPLPLLAGVGTAATLLFAVALGAISGRVPARARWAVAANRPSLVGGAISLLAGPLVALAIVLFL